MPSSPDTRDDAIAILRRLRDNGHVAYFAGGCVRDELLELTPTDYDIATDAPPSRVRELFSNTQAVGAAFGVILVRHRNSVIEVATFRSDGAYRDGRRPQNVTFTTAEADARRRDFTINGLFLDPISGEVIDYVGGRGDLAAGVLRAIGNANERFAEDHLRLLRAVRFAARFDLAIDPATAAAIRLYAQRLKAISPERVGEELRKMLTAPTRTVAWKLLWKLRLIGVIFRSLPSASGDLNPYRSIFADFAPGRTVGFGAALAVAGLDYQNQEVHDGDLRLPLNPQSVSQLARVCRTNLKISNDETAELEQTLGAAGILLNQRLPSVAQLRRLLAWPAIGCARDLLAALSTVRFLQQRIDWVNQQFATLEKLPINPPPLLTGDDLLAAGHRPGPIFKRILDAVYDAQLEDRITNRADALALAESLLAQP